MHLCAHNQLVYACMSSQVVQWERVTPANAGDRRDASLIPGSERSPGVGNDNLLQYSCLQSSMDRGACGLQPLGLQWVGYNWAIEHAHMHTSK